MPETKTSKYWKGRFDQIEQAANNKSISHIHDMDEKYAEAIKNIDSKINTWYKRFANNNDLTMSEAKRLLNDKELKELRWSVKQYIQYGKENAIDQQWMKELENASAKFHINRLEALKLDTQQDIEVLMGGATDDLDNILRSVYKDTYYHSAFEVQKGMEIGFDVAKIDDNKLSSIISKPWTADGNNFSDRLWGNKSKLINTMHDELSRMVLTGSGPKDTIAKIQRVFNTSQNAASRLVMTEQAYFTTLSQNDSFKELGVEEYEVVETLDNSSCDECGDMDGQHFPLSEMEVGINAPPFHPFCRGTTCPYFDNLTGERVARDQEGDTYTVPQNMTYKDWKEQCIKDGNDDYVGGKTKEQFSMYKQMLGKEAPDTLAKFAEEKSNNTTEYQINKKQMKGLNYYNQAVLNEPAITEKIKSIAKETSLDVLGLENRLKEKESFLEKIRRNYREGKKEFEINDIIRYTYGASPETLVEKMNTAVEKLQNMGYTVIKVKNSWLNNSDPYNGINTIVKAPNGQKFELQYHTKESFDLKSGEMHKLYEKQRILSDKKSEEFIALQEKMFDLSDTLRKPKGVERVKSHGGY